MGTIKLKFLIFIIIANSICFSCNKESNMTEFAESINDEDLKEIAVVLQKERINCWVLTNLGISTIIVPKDKLIKARDITLILIEKKSLTIKLKKGIEYSEYDFYKSGKLTPYSPNR